MATMLQLVQQATAEMGLVVPSSVASNATTDVVQILALLNAVGYELQRQYLWQKLTKAYRFTTVYYTLTGTTTEDSQVVTGLSSTTGLSTNFMVIGTGINQDTYVQSVDSATQVTLTQAATATGSTSLSFCQTIYAMPSDYDRIVDRTQWDKSKHWEMLGPETAQQWEWIKSAFISTGPRVRWRILGGAFQIWPPSAINDYLGFEYVSNAWVSSSGATAPDKTSFTADSDTCVFPDRLMVLGVKKKYFEIKGFDTTAFDRDFRNQLDLAQSSDGGSATLSFAPRLSSVLISINNVPDSGYGS